MRRTLTATALAALAALLPAGCSIETVPDDAAAQATPAPDVTLSQKDRTAPHSSLAEVVEEALPSVVNVRVESFDVTGTSSEGQGSGVIIDAGGIILTNFHVVESATEVTVSFQEEGREDLEGEVIGGVRGQDLAIIRVPADDLVPMEIGKSSDLRLGDDVTAIGFPLGLGGPTVTSGIVSATGRNITASSGGRSSRLQNLLQTDAAINPGNSGGPLIDSEGRLVGINTAAVQAGAAENIGFAIPIDQALPIVERILEDPPPDRAWLGVTLDDVTAEVAFELGLPEGGEGAVVLAVVPDSPADEAGLEVGDVVTAIDGDEVDSADALVEELRERDVGEEIELAVLTDGGEETIDVELERRPVTLS
ncbi:MAG TPA: trypsin-like peptidase domain-containing protein [Actinomycetota bacterium]|nr:trypsin-like peptidase domain-containing protein [Actinomycetota bacterium]